MKRYLPALTALTISLIGIAFTPSLKASESDEKTVITISGAVTIQGTLLQPGSYVLKLQDTQSSQDMVFVFNADETRLMGLVRAIPAYRLQPSDKSDLRFITRVQESQRLCTHGSIRASPLALSSGPEFRRGQKLCSLFQNAFGSLMPRRQSGGARRAVYELLAITPDTGFFAALQYAATAHGWTVRWARSVNAAIGVLTCRAITVILYDWCSATEDWTESIDRLKLIAEGPSIVLAAGRVDEELWREALSLRVYDVVSRAGQFEHLFATLRFARKWKSERRDLAGIG